MNRYHISVFMLFVFLITNYWSTNSVAKPLAVSDLIRDPVFYCREQFQDDCDSPSADGQIVAYAGYIKGVIAAEWPTPGGNIYNTQSLEPLKAGSVVARTFAERFAEGCGAKLRNIVHTEPYPPYSFSVMYHISQRFDGGKIEDEHEQARQATDGQVLRRTGDNELACAKYNANNGDPTAASSAEPETLKSVSDPVHDNTCTDCVGAEYAPDMSQNGSVAWFKGNVPWQDYRQALAHYYNSVRIEGVTNAYRWVWLDVDQGTTVHTGIAPNYGEYWGPTVNMPTQMETNQLIPVTINIQNAGDWTWFAGGTIRLSYHWYFNGSALADDSQRGYLPTTLSPGESTVVTIDVHAPSTPGNYEIRFDMLQEDVTWFNQQNNWPTLNVPVTIIKLDTTPPDNPGTLDPGSSHIVSAWSNTNTVYAQWSGASDNETPANQLVYSIDWTTSSATIPDDTIDETDSDATSPSLADGSWWLHIRTRDNAGNWNSGAAHFGPFLIDTSPPSGFHSAPDWSPTAAFTITWSGSDIGSSGINFNFDYNLNNGPYQAWFETTTAVSAATYNLGANVNDIIYIRSCVSDGAGNIASPSCTETQTQYRTSPYLAIDPLKLEHCFVLSDTMLFSSTLSIKNEGPGTLDWTAAVSHSYFSLQPISGLAVSNGFPAQVAYTITNPAVVGQYTGVITINSSTPNVHDAPYIIPAAVRVVSNSCSYNIYLPVIVK